MIKSLLSRPISVLMVFLACVIIGIITYNTLPVSLLPDIAIPEITVQVTGDNTSAHELENTVVKPIRRQLMQVGKLDDIRTYFRGVLAEYEREMIIGRTKSGLLAAKECERLGGRKKGLSPEAKKQLKQQFRCIKAMKIM